jgi:hypothetical protein
MTSTPPTPPAQTVIERLRVLLNALVMQVSGRVASGQIPMALNVFICNRVIGYRQRICDIADRIRAGTYVFRRRTGKPRAPVTAPRKPRPPDLIKQSFGWVLPLIPPYWNANGLSAELESIVQDPEMAGLIEAAPVALGRPLRSLCWMLRVKRPPHLAPPSRTAPRATPPRSASRKAAAATRPPHPASLPCRPPTPPEAPAWMQNWPPEVRRFRKPA